MKQPKFDLSRIPAAQILALTEQYIPLEMCRCYQLLPLAEQHEDPPSLWVGMVNPNDLEALDRLNAIVSKTHHQLERTVLTQDDFQQLLQNLMPQKVTQATDPWKVAEQVNDDEHWVKSDEYAEFLEIDSDIDLAFQGPESASITSLVNRLLARAVQEKASCLHIEPQVDHLRIRFRKDGRLQQACNPLPRTLIPAMIARLKILADLDVAERRLPQSGHCRRVYQDCMMDFTVSTLPCRFGERILIKIQQVETAPLVRLDQLLRNAAISRLLQEMLSKPQGLILVAGQCDSGKSETLYTLLNHCNKPEVNIFTLEGQIERELPGIMQVVALKEPGMDYANGLKALLQQDADTILVDDIPNPETAKILFTAARQCLVLASLSITANEAAIHTLQLMGVENWQITRSVLGVIEPRQLRRLCPDCRLIYRPEPKEFGPLNLPEIPIRCQVIYKAKVLTSEERAIAERAGDNICHRCNGSGYDGQVAICEVLQMTEEMQNLIVVGGRMADIYALAIAQGMKPLSEQGFDLLAQGETTIAELEKALVAKA